MGYNLSPYPSMSDDGSKIITLGCPTPVCTTVAQNIFSVAFYDYSHVVEKYYFPLRKILSCSRLSHGYYIVVFLNRPNFDMISKTDYHYLGIRDWAHKVTLPYTGIYF